MKKILIINTVGFQYEGITTVILNYIKAMNREDLDLRFPVYEDTNPDLKKELEALGRTVVVPDRKKNVKGYIRALFRLLGEGFDVIHIHGNSGTMLIETLLAKLRGVKKIIPHTHNTRTNHPLANTVMKIPMMLLADELMACSELAGNWLYGKHPYTVLNNAIDLQKYRFDPEKRAVHRKAFDVENAFVIGHIGHFTDQKNHEFLIDVFSAFHEEAPEARLLLIGVGPLKEQMRKKVKDLDLEDAVIFAGQCRNAEELYSAMDLFVLPSRWEGLSLVTVEAQTNGLPALVSDEVPQVTRCTDRVRYQSLSDGVSGWVESIRQIRQISYDRRSDLSDAIAQKGFDIQKEAETLRKIYLS